MLFMTCHLSALSFFAYLMSLLWHKIPRKLGNVLYILKRNPWISIRVILNGCGCCNRLPFNKQYKYESNNALFYLRIEYLGSVNSCSEYVNFQNWTFRTEPYIDVVMIPVPAPGFWDGLSNEAGRRLSQRNRPDLAASRRESTSLH